MRLRAAGMHMRMLAFGVAMAGVCGGLALTDNAFNSNGVNTRALSTDAGKSLQQQDKRGDADKLISKNGLLFGSGIRASELSLTQPTKKQKAFVVRSFKKAALSDYDMSTLRIATKKAESTGGAITDPNDFTVPFPEDKTIIYQPERRDPQNFTATRSVAGEYFRVHDENSGTTVVMNGHELLCLMVNNEVGDSWDDDAIKAQIIAAYCHLRYHQEHGLTPTIGFRYGYSEKLEDLVSSVEGQAMLYNGEVINSLYSASTAGYSTSAKNTWGTDFPYLQCVESEYDSDDPNWGIEKKYSRDEVKSMLEGKFGIALSDDVTKWFRVDEVYSVRYVKQITINENDSCTMTGNELCNLVGLKSNALEIKYKDGEFTFRSCGWGHGVGMSQWGAHYFAEHGWTYDQILCHYFPGATLGLSEAAASSEAAPAEEGEDSSSQQETTVVTEAPVQTEQSYEYTQQYTQPTETYTETYTQPYTEYTEPYTQQYTDWTQTEAVYSDPQYGQDQGYQQGGEVTY
ncbi:MAG: SpoIID/LytB domain-containing protein [Ruminococcus sp.]|nr:SpoIID/LytB domain-containing protein [Ruminococcus sp.]